jgi:DNA-binding NarL/FixJ family response regulator
MKKRISISLVEDIPEVREQVQQLIENSDDFLLIASYANAEEALGEIQKSAPDIVIMDINLPGMNGIDCVWKLKSMDSRSKFVMFTIYEDSDQIYEALKAGATGYLLKNITPTRLLDALRELFNGGAPMSTHIARKVVAFFQKTNEIQTDSCLSLREQEVLHWLSKGYLYKEISDKLNISTGTVRQHIHKIYEKLHVQNRTEALNKYYGNNENT